MVWYSIVSKVYLLNETILHLPWSWINSDWFWILACDGHCHCHILLPLLKIKISFFCFQVLKLRSDFFILGDYFIILNTFLVNFRISFHLPHLTQSIWVLLALELKIAIRILKHLFVKYIFTKNLLIKKLYFSAL